MKLEFSRRIFEKKYSKFKNFMKILPVGTEMFHAERGMDRYDEANSRFSQFCESA